MATVKGKLKELRGATVNYISLVDRAATRMPFRVVKRGETEMDLTRIFKRDSKPEVTAVVVRNPSAAVAEAVKAAGFAIDRVAKSDTGVVYHQMAKQPDDVQLIRLSDELVVAVSGLQYLPSDNSLSKMVVADGFYSGISDAMASVGQSLNELVTKSDDPKAAASSAKELLSDFSEYVSGLIGALPSSVFKADTAVKALAKKEDDDEVEKSMCTVCKKDPCVCAKKDGAKDDIAGKDGVSGASTGPQGSDKPATSPAKKDGDKEDIVRGNGIGSEDKGVVSADKFSNVATEQVTNEIKGKDKETDLVGGGGGAQDTGTVATETFANAANETSDTDKRGSGMLDISELLKAVQSIAAKVDALVAKQEASSQKQEKLQNVVDELAQKSETLSGKVKAVITAPPSGAVEVPANGKATVAKAEPRAADGFKGSWDTAFISRRNR
jgi:hypothetical protein